MKLLPLVAAIALAASAPWSSARAQDQAPVVDFEGLMDSDFDLGAGVLSLGTYALAFPPEAPVALQLGVVAPSGDLIAHLPASEQPGTRSEGYARIEARQPGRVRLGRPGVYGIVFQYDNAPITRFQFTLKERSEAGTAYDPRQRFVLDGFWRSLAHITTREIDGRAVPVLTVWLGGPDLPARGGEDAIFMVGLRRDGRLVAQSKRTANLYFPGHYKRREAVLFQPHQPHAADSAELFTMAGLAVDGAYEVRVIRIPDQTRLRTFRFTVAGGRIQQTPRARLDHEPALDVILPFVVRPGPDGTDHLVEATWIGTR